MSFAPALPLAAPEHQSGVRFASRTRLTGRRGSALILTPGLQRAAFGYSVIGWQATVLLGQDHDLGRLLLTVLPPDDGGRCAGADVFPVLEVAALVKGTAIIRFAALPRFGEAERPAAPCIEISRPSRRSLLLALPSPTPGQRPAGSNPLTPVTSTPSKEHPHAT